MAKEHLSWKAIVAAVLSVTLPILLLVVGPLAYRNSDSWTAEPKIVYPKTHVERMIGEFRENNNSFGDTPILVDMTLFVDVPTTRQNELETILAGNQTELKSAVASLLRSAPYQDLLEPSLTTLKRKMKVAMVQATGQETTIFDELVIPDFDATQFN
ncbi:hypothetical protein K2Y11_15915 [bacterium]|nr:hypothetical protein [bacterium]